MTAKEYYSELVHLCAANADPERATRMEQYMRNQFQFYGISSPRRKELIKTINSKIGYPSVEIMTDFIRLCWADPHRELQYIAMDILAKRLKYIDESYGDIFEEMILNKSWWDTVDWIAGRGVGHLFKSYPKIKDRYFKQWHDSDNLWLNRTVILFQLFYEADTDNELLFNTVEHFKTHQDFFIRKACGWALRQYSKSDPDSVRQFLISADGLSSLTRKEAEKYLRT